MIEYSDAERRAYALGWVEGRAALLEGQRAKVARRMTLLLRFYAGLLTLGVALVVWRVLA